MEQDFVMKLCEKGRSLWMLNWCDVSKIKKKGKKIKKNIILLSPKINLNGWKSGKVVVSTAEQI